MTKKPAHRGATAGLSNAFRQVSTERYALEPQRLQAQRLLRRFQFSPEVAAQVAALAYGPRDEWGGAAP